ncbi:nucleotidyltransferase family protein [Kribbella kalugense]|uniref:Molybdenum cofactor cytidylyltransferase n=1 Tax=Kribbella kalugense TaxID=2512221 RepID=A0A4R7ZGU0_9ACTN|nr:NTP transferase domain-containing protein [Kribbella kalugense]TDW15551.1 molybdenum cofactor cytidylyltransferase [Kribbella kalugense]
MFITGLLLGADSSPHLGAPWQLLSYQGGPLLGATLEGARECGFDQLVVTLGSASEQIHDRIDLDGVRVVESPHSDTDSSSIVPALDAVDRRADGIVVLLGDQPGITSATVWSLVAEAATPIGVCRYDDGESHPCWFGRELFGELRTLRSDADLWDPIEDGTHPVTKVDAIGNIPPRATSWENYRQLISTQAAYPTDEGPVETHPVRLPPRPRPRRRTTY